MFNELSSDFSCPIYRHTSRFKISLTEIYHIKELNLLTLISSQHFRYINKIHWHISKYLQWTSANISATSRCLNWTLVSIYSSVPQVGNITDYPDHSFGNYVLNIKICNQVSFELLYVLQHFNVCCCLQFAGVTSACDAS